MQSPPCKCRNERPVTNHHHKTHPYVLRDHERHVDVSTYPSGRSNTVPACLDREYPQVHRSPIYNRTRKKKLGIKSYDADMRGQLAVPSLRRKITGNPHVLITPTHRESLASSRYIPRRQQPDPLYYSPAFKPPATPDEAFIREV